MCAPVLKCQLQGWGLSPLTPTAVADKNGGPRALKIAMGHGQAAPFLIDMFVYRMITPYCTKFDRLTNRKFMEIVGTMQRSDFNGKMHRNRFRLGLRPRARWGSLRHSSRPPSRMGRGIPPPHTLPLSAPMAPRPSRLRRSSPRLRRLDPSLLTPSAFCCLTEAKAHPTSSFWRRHWYGMLSWTIDSLQRFVELLRVIGVGKTLYLFGLLSPPLILHLAKVRLYLVA